MSTSNFSKVASKVLQAMSPKTAATERKAESADRDADWQRVNSYIADVLKDSHVLYAKLARLQGDFGGEELARLMKVSEAVLTIGDELSGFSKAFYEGKYSMLQSEFTYGEEGGAPVPNPKASPKPDVPAPTPAPPAPAPALESSEPLTQDYDVPVEEAGSEVDYSGEEEDEDEESESEKKEEKPSKKG